MPPRTAALIRSMQRRTRSGASDGARAAERRAPSAADLQGLGISTPLFAITAGLFVVAATSSVNWALSAYAMPRIESAWVPGGLAGVIVVALSVIGRLEPPPAAANVFIALGAAGAVAFSNILPQLGLASALLGAYGFTAMIPAWRRRWARHAALAALCALVAPLGVSDETGIGFLLRVGATETAAHVLRWLGLTMVSAHDVLIFENSVALVDAPCAGLKSLFAGAGFFLAASVAFGRGLSARWALLFALFLALLLAGNVLRIVLLVLLREGLGAADLAGALHMPLGLAIFAACCAAGLVGLLRVAGDAPADGAPGPSRRRSGALGALALIVVAAGAVVFAPSSGEAAAGAPERPSPPFASGDYREIALSDTEARFFARQGHIAAGKWAFRADGLAGSMLIVRSSALTGLHAPELCFEGGGLAVEDMQTRRLDGEPGSYRVLTVGPQRQSAIYWVQSRRRVTDSFAERLLDYAWRGEEEWVLVSILFDADAPVGDAERDAWLARMRRHVARMLEQGESAT